MYDIFSLKDIHMPEGFCGGVGMQDIRWKE